MFRGSPVFKVLALFFFLVIVASQTEAFRTLVGFWKDKDGPCPSGYVLIPAETYTSYNFCVAKYEMKNVEGFATSVPNDDVWTEVTQDEAVQLCRALGPGFDLINNKEWQTIARNIADTPVNWSSGTAYSGELNRGHSDGSPSGNTLASSNDNQSCSGTGQSCSASVWSSQRRTFTLSNGEIIWDFAGNAAEWILDGNSAAQGADGYASTFNTSDARQIFYGNDQFCAAPGASPYCGFGQGVVNSAAGGILRGGANGDDLNAGVFSSNLSYADTTVQNWVGFRCVYRNYASPEPCEGAAVGTACSGGGKYAGQLSGTPYMVTPGACNNSVTPQCSGATDTLTKTWGATGTNHTTTDANNGEANTATLDGVWPNTNAAKYCAALMYGGYDDWFLPATNELGLLYTNRTLIGGFGTTYWSSTQTSNNQASTQNLSTGAVAGMAKTAANLLRCVRKMKPAFQAWLPEVTKLNVAYPATSSVWKTVTITNVGQKAAVAVSTAVSAGFSIGSDNCAGQPLAIGASCTLQVRASGVNLDGPKTGTLTISEGSVSQIVPLSGLVSGFPDPCLTATTVGTLCEGGPLYGGTFAYGGGIGTRKLMVTPGGCTDESSPTCAGGPDTVAKAWGATATNHGTVSTTDGQANTGTLAAGWTDTAAAIYCSNMVYGGYDDWYLPAQNELAQLYTNRVSLGGFAAAIYWSSTQATNANARTQNFSTGVWAETAKNTATVRVRCVRRFAGLEVNPTQTAVNIIAPSTSSSPRTITVSNTGSTPTAVLSTSISGALLTIVSGSDTCQGISLPAGETCSFQIQAVGAISDGPLSGTATVTDGALSATVVISGTISGVGDPCSYSPPVGTACWGGARFAGTFGGSELMVTPGGCTNSATPTCSGGNDSVGKAWGTAMQEHAGTNTTDGIGNTALLATGWSDTAAAKYCHDMVYGGYDDWYLPAKDELNYLYGNRTALGGFVNANYWTSTEGTYMIFWTSHAQNMSSGAASTQVQTSSLNVRCLRKGSDFEPDPIAWADFSATSSVETFTGLSVISLELSATIGSGSPLIWYRRNGGAWTQFSPGSPATVSAIAGGTFAFMVSGTAGSTATITIKNLSDGGTVLDTVTGTSPADCGGTWYAGACWYMTPASVSCTTTCASHGGYNSATRTVTGDQGTNAACGNVLAGLGSSDLGPSSSSSSCEDGYQNSGCYINSLSGNFRCTNGATNAGRPGPRPCACNN